MKKRVAVLLAAGLAALCSCGESDVPEAEVPVSSVSLNLGTAEMTAGETILLVATVQPAAAKDKTVTWASSDKSVATVSSSGQVTALAAGTSMVTATAGGKSASCAITVIVPVSSVFLDKERLDMVAGAVAKLTATVQPSDAKDKTVTWSSSDEGVALVDMDGNVTALKGGVATVTAAAGGKSASVQVDVMELTPVSFEVAASGGEIRITVITTRPCHLDSTPGWIKEKSVGNQAYVFSVDPNPETAVRSGDVRFSDENGRALSCTVKQAGADTFQNESFQEGEPGTWKEEVQTL